MADTSDLISQIVEGMDPGCLITKYILVAEVIEESGARTIWTDTQEGATRWDRYGLLTEALKNEESLHLWAALELSEEDEEDE